MGVCSEALQSAEERLDAAKILRQRAEDAIATAYHIADLRLRRRAADEAEKLLEGARELRELAREDVAFVHMMHSMQRFAFQVQNDTIHKVNRK